MSVIDYYQILGIERDADNEQIRRAYLKIALKTHPDISDNSEDHLVFKQATEAYGVLGKTATRRRYDSSFESVKTVVDLFFRTDEGMRVMESMLPAATVASQRGVDLMQVVDVCQEVLEQGGMVDITIERNGKIEKNPLRVPKNSKGTPWCCLHGLGEPGQNGGDPGDLYILLTEQRRDR